MAKKAFCTECRCLIETSEEINEELKFVIACQKDLISDLIRHIDKLEDIMAGKIKDRSNFWLDRTKLKRLNHVS